MKLIILMKSLTRMHILKHELKHIIKDDTKKIMCALGLIPVSVETVCSGVTHAFNKRYGIEAPKTFLKTAFRSSVAVGSVVPKLMFSLLGMSFYKRYEETAADKFACENAQTKTRHLQIFLTNVKTLIGNEE